MDIKWNNISKMLIIIEAEAGDMGTWRLTTLLYFWIDLKIFIIKMLTKHQEKQRPKTSVTQAGNSQTRQSLFLSMFSNTGSLVYNSLQPVRFVLFLDSPGWVTSPYSYLNSLGVILAPVPWLSPTPPLSLLIQWAKSWLTFPLFLMLHPPTPPKTWVELMTCRGQNRVPAL